MPLKQIQQYAKWRMQGESTVIQRKQLLVEHAKHLQRVIENEMAHLSVLREKIDFYEKMN